MRGREQATAYLLRSTNDDRGRNSNAEANFQHCNQTATSHNFAHVDGLRCRHPSSSQFHSNIVIERIGITHAFMVTRRTILGHTLPVAGGTKQWITREIERHGNELQAPRRASAQIS